MKMPKIIYKDEQVKGKKLSKFSFSHHWVFKQTLEKENEKSGQIPFRNMEATYLKMLGRIGIIGSVQAKRFFGWNSKKLRQLVSERKLVQHRLIKNKNVIPVYTLSQRSLELFSMHQQQMKTTQVVQKIITFQFLCAVKERHHDKELKIHCSADPFTFVQINDDKRLILPMDGQNYGKIEAAIAIETIPIILIAESMEHVEPLNHVLNDNARLLLHDDLYVGYNFYQKINGTWNN